MVLSWDVDGLIEHRGIFPVFAGMVPLAQLIDQCTNHFPRIRGDGPDNSRAVAYVLEFSPYSRGWSQGFRLGGHLR